MKVVFLIAMFILGSCLGSFLCCQARRLHLKSKSTKKSNLGSRSVCLHCKYQLAWYDNIPIFSWLFLKGKCRKCHRKIGTAELLSEIGVALAFVCISSTFDLLSANILNWASFIIILIFTITLCFLAIYDGLYGELPSIFLILAISFAAILFGLHIASILSSATFTLDLIWRPALSILILGGTYLILYLVSKGKWVGDGDWLLGLALGLAIYEPWLALLILFLSNLLACFIMLPAFYKTRQHSIYFGPFLIAAYLLISTFSVPLNSFIGM